MYIPVKNEDVIWGKDGKGLWVGRWIKRAV